VGRAIGSGRGLNNLFGLTARRAHFPDVPLIIDAGIGVPCARRAGPGARFDGGAVSTSAFAQAGRSGSDGGQHLPRPSSGRSARLA